eukprot:Amastigsp_a342540_55.p2 type:complete len:119 gc:universal Amastigsp_a342540_55:246-602(+)
MADAGFPSSRATWSSRPGSTSLCFTRGLTSWTTSESRPQSRSSLTSCRSVFSSLTPAHTSTCRCCSRPLATQPTAARERTGTRPPRSAVRTSVLSRRKHSRLALVTRSRCAVRALGPT